MKNNKTKKRKHLKHYSENIFSKYRPILFYKLYKSNLGFHSQKPLFGLADSSTDDSKIFPVRKVLISKLLQYINLSEDKNDHYIIVIEIASSVLGLNISNRKCQHYLAGFNEALFEEERSNIVHFDFSSKFKNIPNMRMVIEKK